jgi:hypothetical protein
MISELDAVVLTSNFPEHSLEAGDVGTVVHVYSDGGAYEVEFVTAAGETVAVLTLTDADVRPMKAREILHTRLLPAV